MHHIPHKLRYKHTEYADSVNHVYQLICRKDYEADLPSSLPFPDLSAYSPSSRRRALAEYESTEHEINGRSLEILSALLSEVQGDISLQRIEERLLSVFPKARLSIEIARKSVSSGRMYAAASILARLPDQMDSCLPLFIDFPLGDSLATDEHVEQTALS